MPITKLKNGQLPDTISSKTVDNSNDINTTTTRLKITGGSNGQVLSTDGSGNLNWATAGGGGGITDGDKGDITVSGSGATWTIDNGVVTYAKMQTGTQRRLLGYGTGSTSLNQINTNQTDSGLFMSGNDLYVSINSTNIADNAVNYGKMQLMSTTSRLLGRGSSSTGNPQEITIGTGLSMSGTTLNALGTPTAVITKTADETVTSSTTVQDDDHLTWTGFTSGKSYWVEINLLASRVNTSNGVSLKFAFNGNSNGYIQHTRIETGVLTDGSASSTVSFNFQNAGVPLAIKLVMALKATNNFTGTFRFAQQVSVATGITVMAGSRMTIWEVA
jgi:hypothetical protein